MPFLVVSAYLEAMPKLKAEETIELINAMAMGTASMNQDTRGRYALKLARQASGRGSRKATMEKSIAAAAGMGIKVIREEPSQRKP